MPRTFFSISLVFGHHQEDLHGQVGENHFRIAISFQMVMRCIERLVESERMLFGQYLLADVIDKSPVLVCGPHEVIFIEIFQQNLSRHIQSCQHQGLLGFLIGFVKIVGERE